MDLTPKNKEYIDSLTHRQLLERIRFARPGDVWFQGGTGRYWMERWGELRDQNTQQAAEDSKSIGW